PSPTSRCAAPGAPPWWARTAPSPPRTRADGTRAGDRDRRAGGLRRVAAAAAAHLPGDHRPDPGLVRGQPVHLLHRRSAHRCRSGPARGRRQGRRIHRPAAAGAGAHRDRDQLRQRRPVPGGAAGLARLDRQRPRRRRGRHSVSPHVAIAPIVLPLLAAALQLLAGERRQRLVVGIGLASCVAVLASAILLLLAAMEQHAGGATTAFYRIGDWPARFGIVLVVDRLSALMLLLAAVVAVAVLPAAAGR